MWDLLAMDGWGEKKNVFVVRVLCCLVCLIFEVDTSHIVELTC